MVEVKNKEKAAEDSRELFGSISEFGHEQVLFCNDNETGLKAIIAIHNTTLGPALGGTRMWEYASDLDALTDVLRLSRGMTFKSAISGLNLGGGKAVIIGNSRTMKTEALMRRFGKFVENLGGKYITAEDVGTSTRDMEYIRMETDHVTGIPEIIGGSGDPSPVTAYTTYLGMKAAVKKLTGSDSLSGKKVVVQGVGNVGYYLCEYLQKEGANIFAYDIYAEKLDRVVKEFGATAITNDAVYTMEALVYAPCALGATVNKDTIPGLNFGVIAGAANNQLLEEVEDAQRLKDKGILYAPDFVINAGGIINCYSELEGYNRERARANAEIVYDTTLNIFNYAEQHDVTTSEAAIALAKKRIEDVGRLHRYI